MIVAVPDHIAFLAQWKSGVALLLYVLGMSFCIAWLSFCIKRKDFLDLIDMHRAGKKGDAFASWCARLGWAFVIVGLIYLVLTAYVGFSLVQLKRA